MSTKLSGRQEAKYAMAELTIANIGTGNGYTIHIPRGAIVVDVGLYTDTAFNSATTTTGTIADDSSTTYVNAQDVKSTGIETVAVTSKFYPTGGTITVSLAETGATATAGHAVAYVGYIQLGNSCSIQD